MTERTKKGLKLAAAAIFAALLVAITLNAAVDFWTPQAELKGPPAPVKEAAAPAIEPAAPLTARPLPAPPWPEQPAAKPAQPAWNQPLYEPKFDGPGTARNGPQGGAQGFAAPDFSSTLNQFAPLSQVLPPSVSATGSDPTGISIRPLFGGKSGGVDSALGTAGSLTGTAGGTVGGATSSAGSLLKR